MAEFCLDCWNEMNETNDPESKYVFSDEPDLCEGCSEIKPVILATKKDYLIYRFRFILVPLDFLCRMLLLPLLLLMALYQYCKRKHEI